MATNIDSVAAEQIDIGEYSPHQRFSIRKLLKFIGPGALISIAYIDPGNFGVDIQSGSQYGTQLIWMLLLATVMGIFVQNLCCKLGVVVQKDLAQQCRSSFHPYLNYTLWAMAEIAVIASDVPEVIGTAFALKLLFGLPLWIGVVVTALDTILILFMQLISVRFIEIFIGVLLFLISSCFVIEMFLTDLDFIDILSGFVPLLNFGHFEGEGDSQGYVAACIGILGSVIMPHNTYLHSALVQSRKLDRSIGSIKEALLYFGIECVLALGVSFFINFAIVIVCASTFYPNFDVGLNDAPVALQHILPHPKVARYAFGIALLCSGQSSTITGTYAGQFVMEGFLDMKISMWKRNLITRTVAMAPSLLVALIFGEKESDQLIVWSQVLLSVQLPFALIPLLKFTSSSAIMGDSLKNSKFEMIAGWIIAVLVVMANQILVVMTLMPFIYQATGLLWYLGVSVMGFAMMIYFWLLGYMALLDVGEGQKQPKIYYEKGKSDDYFGSHEDDHFDTGDSSMIEMEDINTDLYNENEISDIDIMMQNTNITSHKDEITIGEENINDDDD